MSYMRFLSIVMFATLIITASCMFVVRALGWRCEGGVTHGLFVVILMVVAGIVSWLDGRKEYKALLVEKRAILQEEEKSGS